jgi:dephospho-CoA kinase
MTLTVGVTGGIGSGKSAVADAFATLGAPVTDTDSLAHALCMPGERGYLALREAFGDGVLRAVRRCGGAYSPTLPNDSA